MQREWRRERGTVDSSKWLAWIDFGRALHQENMPFLSKKDSHPVPIRCHIMHPYALSACREWCDFCDFWRKPLKLQRKIRQRGGKCVSQEKKGQLKDLLQWSSRLHEPRGPEHRQYREMVECRLLYKSLFFFYLQEQIFQRWGSWGVIWSCWSMLRLLLLELLAVVFWAVAPLLRLLSKTVALWESLTPWHVDVRKQLLWLLTTSSLIASSGVQRIFRDNKNMLHTFTLAKLLFLVLISFSS